MVVIVVECRLLYDFVCCVDCIVEFVLVECFGYVVE